jgi:hypothetical protein
VAARLLAGRQVGETGGTACTVATPSPFSYLLPPLLMLPPTSRSDLARRRRRRTNGQLDARLCGAQGSTRLVDMPLFMA